MAQATFVHTGERIDYTPGSAVAAGDVIVQGDLIGVATEPIAANELGSLVVSGVFAFAKAAGAITVGTILYWDDTANQVTASAGSNKQIGVCSKAAASGDTTVEVELHPNHPAYIAGAVESKATNYTVTAADHGKTFITGAADLIFTLPATALGLTYTFLASTLSTTTGLQVSPAAADKIMGKGITAADDKDYINTGSTDAFGDLITLVGDGVDGWYVVAERGTWARQA